MSIQDKHPNIQFTKYAARAAGHLWLEYIGMTASHFGDHPFSTGGLFQWNPWTFSWQESINNQLDSIKSFFRSGILSCLWSLQKLLKQCHSHCMEKHIVFSSGVPGYLSLSKNGRFTPAMAMLVGKTYWKNHSVSHVWKVQGYLPPLGQVTAVGRWLIHSAAWRKPWFVSTWGDAIRNHCIYDLEKNGSNVFQTAGWRELIYIYI